MQYLILILSFFNVIMWILLGAVQRKKIQYLEKEVINLNSSTTYLKSKYTKLQKDLGYEEQRQAQNIGFIGLAPFIEPDFMYNEPKKPTRIKQVDEIYDILKEAGIIIDPPHNIEVPDPRGYSVKKVK